MRNNRILTVLLAVIMLILVLTSCGNDRIVGSDSSIYPISLYKSETDAGDISCTDTEGNIVAFVEEGDMLRLSIETKEGYRFAGWSKGDYLVNGGEWVSEESSFTFAVERGTMYYANVLKENEVLMLYYANGGTVNGENSQNADVLAQVIDLGIHKYPTTLAQDGTFTREGYNIVEYTSEADGSGVVTNIGQRAYVPNDGTVRLYVQWAKESDTSLFSFEDQGDGYVVTQYTGDETVLSVPAQYNGKDVIGIGAQAVASANIETVVFPSTIRCIQDGAFEGCTSLKKLYLFDTITEMTDESFAGCPIQTVCLNSVYANKYHAEGSGKLELLHYGKDTENSRMIVISGSSGVYGLDSELLQSSLEKDYTVVNFATQIGIPNTFAMSIIKPYLNEGDVIVLAPEIEISQFCNSLTTYTFLKFDGAYTQIRNVDITKFDGFFSALSMFSLAKEVDYDSINDESKQFYSENGDTPADKYEHQDFPATYTFISPVDHPDMTDSMYKQYNAVLDEMEKMGVTCYLSFAPFCTEACEGTVSDEMLDAYSDTFGEKLHAVKISNQSDHNYSKEYFFEMFHMTNEGKTVRTKQLIADLNAQFAKE